MTRPQHTHRGEIEELSEEFVEHAHAKYDHWGVPDEMRGKPITPERLPEILTHIEPRIATETCSIVPSSFEAEDPYLRALPRPNDWVWHSCHDLFAKLDAHFVMTLLPAFWQLSIPLHNACRNAQIPLFANPPQNVPVAALAIRTLHADTIVMAVVDAHPLLAFLQERSITIPKLWIMVHTPRSLRARDVAPLIRAHGSYAAEEVHVFPGVPFLYQCSDLVTAGLAGFHVSGDFVYESREDTTLVSGELQSPFPIVRYEIPLTLVEGERCSCGKQIVLPHTV